MMFKYFSSVALDILSYILAFAFSVSEWSRVLIMRDT